MECQEKMSILSEYVKRLEMGDFTITKIKFETKENPYFIEQRIECPLSRCQVKYARIIKPNELKVKSLTVHYVTFKEGFLVKSVKVKKNAIQKQKVLEKFQEKHDIPEANEDEGEEFYFKGRGCQAKRIKCICTKVERTDPANNPEPIRTYERSHTFSLKWEEVSDPYPLIHLVDNLGNILIPIDWATDTIVRILNPVFELQPRAPGEPLMVRSRMIYEARVKAQVKFIDHLGVCVEAT